MMVVMAMVGAATACATPSRAERYIRGVQAQRITREVYRIIATGNSFSTKKRMEDFVLLRASEIALERGYPGFHVLRVEDESGYTETTSKAKTTIEKTPAGAEVTHHPAETTRWQK